MAKAENTNQRDLWPSLCQRCLGARLYTIDGDEQGLDQGTLEGQFMGFTGRKEMKFAIDYKHISLQDVESQSFSDSYWTMQAQAYFYDCQVKKPVPFFTVLTYLSEEYENKMYFVIPSNNAAKLAFQHYNKHKNGQWMTLLQFSQFQHLLRGITWNGEEIIDTRNLIAAKLPNNLKLKELPNKQVIYPLPQLNFNPNLVEYAAQE